MNALQALALVEYSGLVRTHLERVVTFRFGILQRIVLGPFYWNPRKIIIFGVDENSRSLQSALHELSQLESLVRKRQRQLIVGEDHVCSLNEVESQGRVFVKSDLGRLLFEELVGAFLTVKLLLALELLLH